jgi:hypothetical protein
MAEDLALTPEGIKSVLRALREAQRMHNDELARLLERDAWGIAAESIRKAKP